MGHVGAGPVDARSDVARDAGDDGRSTMCNTSKLDVLGVSYKMGEERWCLAICHTNYQEIDLFRVSRVGTLNTNFLHIVCMANPEQVDFLIIRMTGR